MKEFLDVINCYQLASNLPQNINTLLSKSWHYKLVNLLTKYDLSIDLRYIIWAMSILQSIEATQSSPTFQFRKVSRLLLINIIFVIIISSNATLNLIVIIIIIKLINE